MTFPSQRPRRLRAKPALRRLARETQLGPQDLVYPLFPREGIEEPVDHQGVEFVGERPRRAIVRAGRDVPEVVEVALGVGAPQMDGDAAVGREIVDGEAGEHRFGAQDAQRRPWGRTGGLGDGGAGRGDHGRAPFRPEAMCPTHDTVCGVFSTVFFTV